MKGLKIREKKRWSWWRDYIYIKWHIHTFDIWYIYICTHTHLWHVYIHVITLIAHFCPPPSHLKCRCFRFGIPRWPLEIVSSRTTRCTAESWFFLSFKPQVTGRTTQDLRIAECLQIGFFELTLRKRDLLERCVMLRKLFVLLSNCFLCKYLIILRFGLEYISPKQCFTKILWLIEYSLR